MEITKENRKSLAVTMDGYLFYGGSEKYLLQFKIRGHSEKKAHFPGKDPLISFSSLFCSRRKINRI